MGLGLGLGLGLGSGLGLGLGRAARQPSAARCSPMSRPLHAASSSRLPPALVESSRAAKAASTLVEG